VIAYVVSVIVLVILDIDVGRKRQMNPMKKFRFFSIEDNIFDIVNVGCDYE